MFNSKLISSYIIVFSFVHSFELHKSHEPINVGTVLFSPSDLNKARWNRENIELLEARRYFQDILPSPNSIDCLSDHYVNDLIKYFANVFTTVKREADDPESAQIMEKALSDTVAGYFKVWVLPVTKFAYYGGIVSAKNAMKSFEYYEGLKNNLNTDGREWRIPNNDILDTIAISVIPFSRIQRTRSMRKPCEHIAYFEKYDNTLSMAIPYINWNESPSSMFLPLKDQASVLLDSPSSAKSLLKYYDIAESCCQANGVEGCNEFDLKFQDWLSNDVVPHLNDDKLYFALGGVLSLLNETKDLYEKIADPSMHDGQKCGQKSIFTNFLPMSSRKLLILIVVLFLEIIWCIPALFFLLCCKKRKNMTNRIRYFLNIFKRRRCSSYDFETIERVSKTDVNDNLRDPYTSRDFIEIYQPHMNENNFKFFQKPRAQNTEVDTQYPSHTSKRSTGQVTESFPDIVNIDYNESVTIINEMPQKSFAKKETLHYNNASHNYTTPCLSVSKDMNDTILAQNVATVKNVEPLPEKPIKDRCDSSIKSIIKNISHNNSSLRVGLEVKQKLQELDTKDETKDKCPCTCCFDDSKKTIEKTPKKIKRMELKKFKPDFVKRSVNIHLRNSSQSNRGASCSKTTKLQKPTPPKCCVQKETMLNKTKDRKSIRGDPLLEIRIDTIAAKTTGNVTKCSESFRKNAKPSKIPLRAPNRNIDDYSKQDKLSPTQTCEACICTKQVHKVIKKKVVDDFVLQKKPVKRNKLNITL